MKTINVLIIAYHFPPQHGSSGLLRTLKFVRYLGNYDIKPTVLTVHKRAYERLDFELLSQIPDNVDVFAAFALDTKKHLSVSGRYWEPLAIPDRFASWIPFGIRSGCRLVKKNNIDIVFATYPIASAMAIGTRVSQLTKTPFVADFRDPMYDEYSILSKKILEARQTIEASAVKNCAHVLVTTPGALALYRDRYPYLSSDKISVIPNGYDEHDFSQLKQKTSQKRNYIRIIHAGLLDPDDRNPLPFFHALNILKSQNLFEKFPLKVELFAPGHDDHYEKSISDLNLQHIIEVKKAIPYSEMLTEMFDSEILLLYQGISCDIQIPAKAYEYLRIGKPILAFATENGDTGKFVKSTDAGLLISDNDPAVIANKFAAWLPKAVNGFAHSASYAKNITDFSREKHSEMLATIFCSLATAK